MALTYRFSSIRQLTLIWCPLTVKGKRRLRFEGEILSNEESPVNFKEKPNFAT